MLEFIVFIILLGASAAAYRQIDPHSPYPIEGLWWFPISVLLLVCALIVLFSLLF